MKPPFANMKKTEGAEYGKGGGENKGLIWNVLNLPVRYPWRHVMWAVAVHKGGLS